MQDITQKERELLSMQLERLRNDDLVHVYDILLDGMGGVIDFHKLDRITFNRVQKYVQKCFWKDEQQQGDEEESETEEQYQKILNQIEQNILLNKRKLEESERMEGESPQQDLKQYLQDSEEIWWNKALEVLIELRSHPWSWPFAVPIDPEALGMFDYYDIIEEPMDLETVYAKLRDMKYQGWKDFESDIYLIFNNCLTYNKPNTQIAMMAKALGDLFQKLSYQAQVDIERESKKEKIQTSKRLENTSIVSIDDRSHELEMEINSIKENISHLQKVEKEKGVLAQKMKQYINDDSQNNISFSHLTKQSNASEQSIASEQSNASVSDNLISEDMNNSLVPITDYTSHDDSESEEESTQFQHINLKEYLPKNTVNPKRIIYQKKSGLTNTKKHWFPSPERSQLSENEQTFESIEKRSNPVQNSSYSVKLHFTGQNGQTIVKRFKLHIDDRVFSSFLSHIRKILNVPIKFEHYIIEIQDDENDWIDVEDQEQWQEVLHSLRVSIPVIRVRITPK